MEISMADTDGSENKNSDFKTRLEAIRKSKLHKGKDQEE